ncbi:MAG TPA: polysaccharide deacetylase family protein [Streptosporangiaceae bacterium]|nr:polysaccharide deacetylase family protein [Streptosporangiaceae bacterium]
MPQLHKLACVFIVCAVVAGLMAPKDERRGDRQRAAGAAAPHGAASAVPAKAAASRSARPRTTPAAVATIAPEQARRVRANELGQVPVLMYHRILAKAITPYDRSPAELRGELERLAKSAYVPVTAAEFATGRIDIPAGTHPVVLTFDDGYPSHLALDARGNPLPDTAVGVILDVARRYPWFRPVGTFYLIKDPFMMGGRARAGVRWLIEHGFEVGNHTTNHTDLATASRAKVRQEIGTDQKTLTDLGGVAPVTFAFPYGAPSHLSWAAHGSAGGASWDFAGMFLAGWRPADSPFSKAFQPMAIPRVRSEEKIKKEGCDQFCSTAWLDWLDKNPGKRYTSDGDPAAISFPSAETGSLAQRFRGRGRPY